MKALIQGSPAPVLEGRSPACLRCFPASAYLIQMNGSLTDLDDGLMAIHSFESGVLKQENISDVKDSGAPGPEFDTPALISAVTVITQ